MFGRLTFKGGIHLTPYKKQAATLPIEVLPAPEKITIPVLMHQGAPARVIVKLGDHVKIGRMIAEAVGTMSASAHAPVSGEISGIGSFPHPHGKHIIAIEITNDKKEEHVLYQPLDKDWREAAPGEIVKKISLCGVVCTSGHGFPTHVKLTPASNNKIDTLIVSGIECEPYGTAVQRLMIEKTAEILTGAMISKKTTGAQKAFIVVEDDKPDVYALAEKKRAELKINDITIIKVKAKYPQGSEQQLVAVVAKREIPSRRTAQDAGCAVLHAGTVYAIWDAVCNGVPFYQRVITVSGPCIKKPANLLIRFGTPIQYVLEYCQADFSSMKKCVMGGPLTGFALPDITPPVIKSTSGLFAYDTIFPGVQAYNCINCSKCVSVCPIHLVPSMLAKFVEKERYDDAEAWNIMDCIECGSCSYICPSKINLIHFLTLGKFHIAALQKIHGNELKK